MHLKDLETINKAANRLKKITAILDDDLAKGDDAKLSIGSAAGGYFDLWTNKDRFRNYLVEERRILEDQLIALGVKVED